MEQFSSSMEPNLETCYKCGEFDPDVEAVLWWMSFFRDRFSLTSQYSFSSISCTLAISVTQHPVHVDKLRNSHNGSFESCHSIACAGGQWTTRVICFTA